MGVRILLAAVLSALAMFVWGFVFWVVTGAAFKMMSPLPTAVEADITAVLRREKVPSGMYMYPMPANPADEAASKAAEDQSRQGPRFQLAVSADGSAPMPPKMLAAGFASMLAIALAVGVLTAFALPALPTFGRRFTFVALVTLVGIVWTNPADMVWWHHPLEYCLGEMLHGLVAGLLMAAVMAAILRPDSQVSA